MNKSAIIVEGISKRYRLGHANTRHQTFREMAMGMLAAPFRKLRAAGEAGNEGEEFWALKDVNFEVQPGEVVGIIGRNGAGKSTLLKILSRITEPTSGQIRLRGRVASLLEVGTGFHPELTGRENIYLNGAILGMKRAEITEKFDEIVAFAETEKFLDTPVKFYSSGMYVRLAFAVAAHLEPEILIVDEVLAVGDAEFQKKCLGKMRTIAEGSGRTVLFVSHNITAVESLCSKALVLKQGQKTYFGGVAEGVHQYIRLDTKTSKCIPSCRGIGLELHSAEVFAENGHVVRSFENAKIDLAITPNIDVFNLGMQILIESVNGNPVAELDTAPSHPRLSLSQNVRSVVRVSLSEIPLRPGQYRIHLVLRDDGKYNRWEVPYPLLLEVEPSLNPQLNTRNATPLGITAIRFGRQLVADSIDAPFGMVNQVEHTLDRSPQ
jgi:lipopolysaccharide transport system ATP-binding protein